ncbi:MAG: efflux RND transporter permease subunit [Desulfomicrobium escambiense]|nr:efflux RND transporter permease subunit [Desulfomicrobium escambiense]
MQASGQLDPGRALPLGHRHLPRRPPGAPGGHRHGLRQRRKQQGRRLVHRPALHHPGRPAPARHQHRRGGRARSSSCCPLFQAQLPASVVPAHPLRPPRCRSRSRSTTSSSRCCFTLALVVLVIFLFLRRLSYTVIPSLAMPMSLVGTFIVMYLMGYNIDNLSLMALILAVGFVVDDAIVMLENIVRHIEMGEGPIKAALNGSREIGFTIVSMTLSLVAVFIPILFMGGILGRLFQRVRRHHRGGHPDLGRGLPDPDPHALQPVPASRTPTQPPGPALRRLRARSTTAMLGALRAQPALVPATTAASPCRHPGARDRRSRSCSSAWCPRGFIPSEDRAIVYGPTEAAEGISFEAMKRLQQAVAEIVAPGPQRRGVHVQRRLAAGRHRRRQHGHPVPARSSRATSASSPPTRSSSSCGRSSPRCRGSASSCRTRRPSSVGGRVTKSQYQYTLQGTDIEELYRIAPQLGRQDAGAARVPGRHHRPAAAATRRSTSTSTATRPPSLGVSAEQIEDALYSAYGSRQISTIYADTNQYQVILELKPEYQLRPGRAVAALRALLERGAGAAGRARRASARATARCPSTTAASCRR